VAFVALNGLRSSTLNWQNFSQITFAFTVTPRLVLSGMAYGLLLTFLGGLLPGLRAARAPVTSGLRAL
jgi:putative ABC transport system permease protein